MELSKLILLQTVNRCFSVNIDRPFSRRQLFGILTIGERNFGVYSGWRTTVPQKFQQQKASGNFAASSRSI
jgi:hypothetical protein